jgi:hypothetical protein
MTRKNVILGAAICLAILFGVLGAEARKTNEMMVKIAFPFTAGEQAFPAGSYLIARPAGEAGAVGPFSAFQVSQVDGSLKTTVKVITRLAREEKILTSKAPTLVFDVVGETRFLSEIWLVNQDGFLVRGTTEEHKHQVTMGN